MKKLLLTLTPLLLMITAKAQTTDTSKVKPHKYIEEMIDRPVNETVDPDKIFTSVELEPEFPGGLDAFSRFLATNLRYPKIAHRNNKQGRVIVTMVVEKDGTLSDVRIARGVSNDLNAEAIRVVKLSAKWKPGKHNGLPVRVAYAVPIDFTLGN